MAIDPKYGKVMVEHPGPEEDEVVIVFRAQDKLLLQVLDFYNQLCRDYGSPSHHLDLIEATREQVIAWQHENRERVRVPNSNRWAERTGGVQST